MIKNNLKKIRVRHGLKAKYIAEQMGVSVQAVSAWESTNPATQVYMKIHQLNKLSLLYGQHNIDVTLDDFYTLEELPVANAGKLD